LQRAWDALQEHEKHLPRVSDDQIIRVIVEGKSLLIWDFTEHAGILGIGLEE
jgi:hypothetical protein